jgi:hypothetical protein
MISEIKNRRQANVAQALSMLDLAASSDLETKRSLLSIAARCLLDPRVARRWVELAQQETDGALRRAMIAALRTTPEGYVPLLISSLLVEQTRTIAIQELGRLHEAVDPLIETYRHQKRTSVKRHILAVLLQYDDPPPKILDFLSEAVSNLPTGENLARELQQAAQEIAFSNRPPQDKAEAIARLQQEFQQQILIDYEPLKAAIVDRLLRADRFDPRWLRPTEPVLVRRRVLSFLLDRPVDCSDVLANDPDPECRRLAVQVMAALGKSGPLLEAVRRDRDSSVRKAALDALDSIELDPAIVENESSPEIVGLILKRLAPLAGRSEKVRAVLLSLLGPDLKAEIAKTVYEILGRVMTRELFEMFLKTYETAREDRIRAAVLQALSTWHEPDDRLSKLYVEALKSPKPEIREWAAHGLILLPLTESNIPAVGAGAGALLELRRDTALRLAEKIVRIPRMSDDVRAALKKASRFSTDDDLRRVCRTDDIDWDEWLRRVSVEHDITGIFPAIYAAYDSNPEAATQILRAALIDPQCRSHDVSPISILEFLISKHGMDDDLCRYCLDNRFLAYLKLRPHFPELKERIWEALDASPVLLREILIMMFGDAAGDEVRKRAKPEPRWIKFLEGNILWPPAKPILAQFEKPRKGPGLADE